MSLSDGFPACRHRIVKVCGVVSCVSTAPEIGKRKDRRRFSAKHIHASSLSPLNLRLTAESSPYLVRLHFVGER
jgi:hypothetical protein